MESIPQVHIMIIIGTLSTNLTMGNTQPEDVVIDVLNQQTIATFCLSILSAALGIAKFLKVGPCRLLPYDKINFGFFLLTLNIVCGLIWKAIFLPLIIFLRLGQIRTICSVMIWISVSILPQMALVGYLLTQSDK